MEILSSAATNIRIPLNDRARFFNFLLARLVQISFQLSAVLTQMHEFFFLICSNHSRNVSKQGFGLSLNSISPVGVSS